MKILLHQRKQIPEQIDVLKRLSSTFDRQRALNVDENVANNSDAKSRGNVKTFDRCDVLQSRRDEMRQKRSELRRNKTEKRFIEKATKVVENFDRLVKNFFDEIVVGQTTGQVEEVAIVFGATPVTFLIS